MGRPELSYDGRMGETSYRRVDLILDRISFCFALASCILVYLAYRSVPLLFTIRHQWQFYVYFGASIALASTSCLLSLVVLWRTRGGTGLTAFTFLAAMISFFVVLVLFF